MKRVGKGPLQRNQIGWTPRSVSTDSHESDSRDTNTEVRTRGGRKARFRHVRAEITISATADFEFTMGNCHEEIFRWHWWNSFDWDGN